VTPIRKLFRAIVALLNTACAPYLPRSPLMPRKHRKQKAALLCALIGRPLRSHRRVTWVTAFL
jgi:hypothetical protein